MRVLATFALAGVALGTALAPALPAQGPTQEELKSRYQDKLDKEFVKHGGWITDYDQARARAKEEGKVLFVYFTRSYAH